MSSLISRLGHDLTGIELHPADGIDSIGHGALLWAWRRYPRFGRACQLVVSHGKTDAIGGATQHMSVRRFEAPGRRPIRLSRSSRDARASPGRLTRAHQPLDERRDADFAWQATEMRAEDDSR